MSFGVCSRDPTGYNDECSHLHFFSSLWVDILTKNLKSKIPLGLPEGRLAQWKEFSIKQQLWEGRVPSLRTQRKGSTSRISEKLNSRIPSNSRMVTGERAWQVGVGNSLLGTAPWGQPPGISLPCFGNKCIGLDSRILVLLKEWIYAW